MTHIKINYTAFGWDVVLMHDEEEHPMLLRSFPKKGYVFAAAYGYATKLGSLLDLGVKDEDGNVCH